MFKTTKKDKISTLIIRQIREAILQGQIKSGEALPPEKDLVQQFGVSKHTLREALRTLEGMGLIDIRRGAGGGPVVTEVNPETARDFLQSFFHFQNISIRDLSDVRKIIEPYLARRAAETFDAKDTQDLLDLHEECQKVYREDKNLVGAKAEINFHILLARKTGNPILVMILDFVNSLLTDVKHHLKPGRLFSEKVLGAHQHIIDAIVRKDGEAASKAMYNHISQVERELENVRQAVESGPEIAVGVRKSIDDGGVEKQHPENAV
ncbi:FadR/GntR family transcriptional regulator [Solidesulfovibrio sp.]|uniref:FadR/GntR family transcriptional regulator n=1 Tax=Solidesulfovibrio sp. TaxID=2910990 RepID=UPI002B21C17C|nr:FadR/GntR family transcriptional regulator [Solidesulfovibrio sp.]MEA4855387.1 FadR/GntR family transcriptional regulator [Solidesulfovibrio sp.]